MAALFNVTKCGCCPASIIRATSTAGRRVMEIDAEPHPDGMLLLQWRDGILYVQPVPMATRETMRRTHGGLHRAHLATCPGRSR